jgi:hypothetical protein
MSFLPLVRLWLWISVLATAAGWLLSALGQLNPIGYFVVFCVTALLLWFGRKSWGASTSSAASLSWRKVRRRFTRPLPLAFVVLSFLILLGGVLYPPSNHTALTYRIPRVLQWLARGHWFWIHTSDYRMNDRACGIEWLSAPLLLFTKSDRSLFLLNFIPFLLLPGLVFSLFSRLGVRSRVAWQWMWLLPTGYTFLLQAGSAGNDTFPTVYLLAAMDFACRAWNSRRPSDRWHSLLAAALMTGAKASNLPLLLPWALVFFPSLWFASAAEGAPKNPSPPASPPWIRRCKRVISVVLLLAAVLVSFLPTAILNLRYCGDWSGLTLELPGMQMKEPLVGIWGNCFLFLLDNLIPPFFPIAGWWNQHALSVLPQWLVGPLVANFEPSFHWLWELPTEDWVGLGFGVSWLVIFAVLAAWRIGPDPNPQGAPRDALPGGLRRWVILSAWMALLAYCIKSGMATGARLISPYYPLLLPLVLAGARQAVIVRRRWWQVMIWIVVGLALPVLVLTPGRPLWPAHTILSRLQTLYPEQRLIARALNVYSVYNIRADPLAGVRSLLPAELRVVGFMARGDDTDISFWRPLGSRRVEHVLVNDSAAEIRQRGIEYVVAGDYNFELNGTSFAAWQHSTGAQLIAETNATVRVSEKPQTWYVVRFPM